MRGRDALRGIGQSRLGSPAATVKSHFLLKGWFPGSGDDPCGPRAAPSQEISPSGLCRHAFSTTVAGAAPGFDRLPDFLPFPSRTAPRVRDHLNTAAGLRRIAKRHAVERLRHADFPVA
ncbi:unnamed protein product [Ciceribacter sp. T2.26MG-112.2]|nr:unnamed protein product [Ciceribacter naphthalenivorans]